MYKTSFISNEQVAKSGFTLAGKMGITIERATDDFRRPGYNWSYGSWAAFYMDKPVNSYTTAVTMCDILKNDMKVPETKTTPVELNGYVKGDATKGTVGKLMGGKEATALNYYAVDCFKYTVWNTGANTSVTLQHQPNKSCQVLYTNLFTVAHLRWPGAIDAGLRNGRRLGHHHHPHLPCRSHRCQQEHQVHPRCWRDC